MPLTLLTPARTGAPWPDPAEGRWASGAGLPGGLPARRRPLPAK
jgi:hypothetical protein